ncbi:hypothetical protein [Falsibacillus pallidus]|uniref:hypothetical protein n=1 Tax=Falsibacillus pallidus TaxID=493781 RepID=UPI003D9700C2
MCGFNIVCCIICTVTASIAMVIVRILDDDAVCTNQDLIGIDIKDAIVVISIIVI